MRSLYFLTATLFLASASIIARTGAKPYEDSLQRRFPGNIPGERGYYYRDDPQWEGNRRGGYTREELLGQDERARRNNRDPPPALRPAQDSTSVSRRSTSTDHYGIPEIRPRPRREEQVKTTKKIRYTSTTEYPGGDEASWEIGAQFPPPKQGIKTYGDFGGKVKVEQEVLSPGGKVSVGTYQTGGVKAALGPIYADLSYTKKQDLNPPRPQPVQNPIRGRHNYYHMIRSDGTKRPVFFDQNGHLRSENSGDRLRQTDVYLNNPGRRRKRSDSVLGTIETAANAPSNSSDSLQADWQSYYSIYTGLRANATNLLFPIFKDLVNKSNTSYAYEMAWSIQSQLTGSPNEYEEGPYLNGLVNFDNFTDSWLLSQGFLLDTEGTIYQPANKSLSNNTLLLAAEMLSINDYLQTTYFETWNASVAAINVTQDGSPHTLLEDLVYYANVITATNNTNILPESFYTVDLTSAGQEAAWFLEGLNSCW